MVTPAASRAAGAVLGLELGQTATDHVIGFALRFGHEIGEIGRQLTQHPKLAPKVRAFIERTAPVVVRDLLLGRWFGSVYDAAESRSSDTEDSRFREQTQLARSAREALLTSILGRSIVARSQKTFCDSEAEQFGIADPTLTRDELERWNALGA